MKGEESKRLTDHELVTLVELLKLGAAGSILDLTSDALGSRLGISQQAASLRLTSLETKGCIERKHSGRGVSVRLTSAGLEQLGEHYATLRDAFEPKARSLEFVGTVFKGFGEGGYYISHPGYAKQFVTVLGFKPFPGTLNLRLAAQEQRGRRELLRNTPGLEVGGFVDGKRSFGPVKCFKATIGGKVPGAALAIERTHYDDSVLEVISASRLKSILGLADGDTCAVQVEL